MNLRPRYICIIGGWLIGLIGAIVILSSLTPFLEAYRSGGSLLLVETTAILRLIGGIASCLVGHLLLQYYKAN